MWFSFLEQKRRRVWAFFLEQKIGVLCVFFWSRKFAAAVLFAAEFFFSQFFRQSERLICAVAEKGIFFGYTFTERFSYSNQIQRTVFG